MGQKEKKKKKTDQHLPLGNSVSSENNKSAYIKGIKKHKIETANL